MRKGRFGRIVLLLVAVMLLPLPAKSQPLLRLATVDTFPPFSFREQGRLTGVDVDVVNEMARRIGLKIELEVYPWVRVIDFVKDGTVDGGFSAFLTERRKTFCLYAGVLHFEEFHVFVKKGGEFSFSDIKDLYGKTIGTEIGVHVSDAFELAVMEGKIMVEKVTDKDSLNLKKLSMGRIDAMIGDFGVTTYHVDKMKLGAEIVSLGPVHEKQAAYLILSKKSAFPDKQAWQERIQSALEQIRTDGTYQSILNRYTPVKQVH